MPRVTMKLTAKERKEGRDLRDYTVVPIKDASMRRRMGGAAMLVSKPKVKPKKKQEKVKKSMSQLVDWAIEHHPKEMSEVSTAEEELKVASELWAERMKKEPEPEVTLLVCSNDIEAIEDEIEEWDNSANLDVVKTFSPSKLAEAKKSADASAKGSNVDFVVYEVREIYRAKRGF